MAQQVKGACCRAWCLQYEPQDGETWLLDIVLCPPRVLHSTGTHTFICTPPTDTHTPYVCALFLCVWFWFFVSLCGCPGIRSVDRTSFASLVLGLKVYATIPGYTHTFLKKIHFWFYFALRILWNLWITVTCTLLLEGCRTVALQTGKWGWWLFVVVWFFCFLRLGFSIAFGAVLELSL